ncbi:MAG: response regulator [Acidobacteriaceae bacterium]
MDDDEAVLDGLRPILEAHEFDVTVASNVMDALRHITSESFDVLLSDLHMPGPADGLTVVSAMRHANPKALTIILSANPDMSKAADTILKQPDEIIMKPVKGGAIVQVIRQRLAPPPPPPEPVAAQPVAAMLERESAAITEAWLRRMGETGGLKAVPLPREEQAGYLADALKEIVYRLRYPQPLGSMTLFSMASLQHGARRRRQGFAAPLLVEEARALQVVLFEAIEANAARMDAAQLPGTLMAIADEVNAQLLQSLSGYENEKPVEFPQFER